MPARMNRPVKKESPMARDILKTLQAEHDTLRELFAKMKDTTDRAVKPRDTLLQEIETNLMPHAMWEEQVFYPAFRDRADRDGQQTYAEALAEHHAIENSVIPEVNAAEPGTPEFAGRVKVFAEQIDHHAKEEEKTMFKMARELFSAEERAQLDEDYESWKGSTSASDLLVAQKANAKRATQSLQ
jgi:hemerythrin-like domain-containing protein